MIPQLIRLRSAAALTACAVALLGAAVSEGPARAADRPTLHMEVANADIGLPPGGSDDPPQISWGLFPPAGASADDVHVTLDLTGISAFATDHDECADYVCERGSDHLDASGMGGVIDLDAEPGVPLGTTGTAVLSGTASDATITPVTVYVTVGAVGLEVGELPDVDHAEPGSTVDAPFVIANRGQLPSPGVDLRLITSGGLGFAQRFANCDYSTKPLDPGHPELPNGVLCHISTPLRPGTRYRLSTPFGLAVTGRALWEEVRYSVAPGGGGAPTTAGAGPVLSLVPDGAAPTTGQASATWAVDADNTADFAAGGGSVHGEPGGRVVVTARVRDDGPASVQDEVDDNQPAVMVDIPKGTTAVKVPGGCNPWDGHGPGAPAPGAPAYICALPSPFEAGQAVGLPFTLRIGADAPAVTTGTIRATTVYDTGLPFDPDHADDTATLTVHVKGGVTASPSPAAGGGGAAGDSGGNQPSTRSAASTTPGAGSGPTGGAGALASTGGDGTGVLTWTGAAALAFGGAAFALALALRARHRAAGI